MFTYTAYVYKIRSYHIFFFIIKPTEQNLHQVLKFYFILTAILQSVVGPYLKLKYRHIDEINNEFVNRQSEQRNHDR